MAELIPEQASGRSRGRRPRAVKAVTERLSRFRCVGCGYGASCKIAPERCPMCTGKTWEYEERSGQPDLDWPLGAPEPHVKKPSTQQEGGRNAEQARHVKNEKQYEALKDKGMSKSGPPGSPTHGVVEPRRQKLAFGLGRDPRRRRAGPPPRRRRPGARAARLPLARTRRPHTTAFHLFKSDVRKGARRSRPVASSRAA